MGVPVPKQKALLKLFSIFGHFPPNKFGVTSLKDKTTPMVWLFACGAYWIRTNDPRPVKAML